MKDIVIARDFSEYPAGRTRKDGPNNGERFRKEFLLPALQNAIESNQEIHVILDGTRSFGSSFLEEAFGGLVRCEGLNHSDISKHLKIVANNKVYYTYKRLIERYIKSARSEDDAR